LWDIVPTFYKIILQNSLVCKTCFYLLDIIPTYIDFVKKIVLSVQVMQEDVDMEEVYDDEDDNKSGILIPANQRRLILTTSGANGTPFLLSRKFSTGGCFDR